MTDPDLIALLRREGRYSGVWFGPHMLKACDELERLDAEVRCAKAIMRQIQECTSEHGGAAKALTLTRAFLAGEVQP